jgi:hypothetical protein
MKTKIKWTKKIPTKPGHYWVRFPNIGYDTRSGITKTVLHLEMWRDILQCYFHEEWRPIDNKHYWGRCEWWPVAVTEPE